MPVPDMHAPLPLKVFLASPNDVSDERALARAVLESIPNQPFLRGRVSIRVVAWDTPLAETPLFANLTPQDAIRRQLPKPSECDIVVVLFWSRFGTALPETYRKVDGSPYLSGTEWEYEDAVNSDHCPPVLLYRRTDRVLIDLDDPQCEEKQHQYRLVQRFFSRLNAGCARSPGGYTTYQTPTEFQRRFESDVRFILEARLTGMVASTGMAETYTGRRWDGPPYPGLRSFTQAESAIFFGRGHETDELLKRLSDQDATFLAIIGASGCGKSSLVAAGLLPRLRANAVSGSKDWVLLRFTPGEAGSDPLLAIRAQVRSLMPGDGLSPSAVVHELLREPSRAGAICADVLRYRPSWSELLIFIDQFEELWTIVEPGRRASFMEALNSIMRIGRLRVIITLRSDFLGRVSESAQLPDLIRRGYFLLLPPGWQALTEIILRPAEAAGLALEDGLADRIVLDTHLEPGALPLLAYTLELLCKMMVDRRLTHAGYLSVGEITGAIARCAEASFNSAPLPTQAALGRLFRELITIDETGAVGRLRAAKQSITDEGALKLAERLIQSRLLIADLRNGVETLEVAHEALFESWPRLRAWLQDDLDFLRWRRRLHFFIAEWERSNRSEQALLQGPLLEDAVRWAARRKSDLTDRECEFVFWTKHNAYHIEKLIRRSHTVIDAADEGARAEWLRALVSFGRVEAAFAVVHEITDDSGRARALIQIVPLLVDAGEPKQALTFANEAVGFARNTSEEQQSLATLAQALIANNELPEALLVTGKIARPSDRAAILLSLAEERLAKGYVESAIRIADQVSAVALDISDYWFRADIATRAALVFAADGRLRRALKILRVVDDVHQRSYALRKLADAFAAALHVNLAVAVARHLPLAERWEALDSVAGILLSRGALRQARDVIALARRSDDRFTEERLIPHLISLGEVDEALAEFHRLNPECRTPVLVVDLGRALLASGRLSEAISIVAQLGAARDRALVLNEFLISVIGSANRDQIGSVVEALRSLLTQYPALQCEEVTANAIRTLVQSHRFEQAIALAHDTVAALTTVRRLAGIAVAASAAGSQAVAECALDAAITSARGLSASVDLRDAIIAFSKVAVEMGRVASALSAAQTISDRRHRAAALISLVRACAATPGHPSAAAIAAEAASACAGAELESADDDLVTAAALFIETARLPAAHSICRMIRDANRRACAYCDTAVAYLRSGDAATAADIARSVAHDAKLRFDGSDAIDDRVASLVGSFVLAGEVDLARSVGETADQSRLCSVIQKVIRDLVLSGRMGDAVAAGALINSESARLQAFATLWPQLITAGELDMVVAVVDHQVDDCERASVLVSILPCLVSVRKGAASAVAERLRGIWEDLGMPGVLQQFAPVAPASETRADAATATRAYNGPEGIAEVLDVIKAGDPNAALALISEMPSTWGRVIALCAGTRHLIASRDSAYASAFIGHAIAAVDGLTDVSFQDSGLQQLATLMVSVGKGAEGLSLAHKIRGMQTRRNAFLEVGSMLAQACARTDAAAAFVAAVASACSIGSEFEEADTMIEVIPRLIRLEEWEEALSIAYRLKDLWQSRDMTSAIRQAQAQAAKANVPRPEEHSQSFVEGQERLSAGEPIDRAQVQIAAGDFHGALTYIHRILQNSDRLKALVALTTAWVSRGEANEAAKVAAEALALLRAPGSVPISNDELKAVCLPLLAADDLHNALQPSGLMQDAAACADALLQLAEVGLSIGATHCCPT